MTSTIATVNANGWRRKRNLIQNLLDTDLINILAVTETHALPNQQFHIPRYYTFRKDTDGHHGTALLIHNSHVTTPFFLPPQFDHLEYSAATVHLPIGPTVFISYYNPPSHTLPLTLLDYVSRIPKAVLLGDLNARHTSFGDSTSNPNGIILSNALLSLPLSRIHNSNPTFISFRGTSIPDHIITSENLLLFFEDSCTVGTTITSDHLPLLAQCTLAPPILPPAQQKTIPDYNKTDWTNFRRELESILPPRPQPINTSQDIDAAVESLTTSIQHTILNHIPTKIIHINRKPLPPNITRLIKHKRRVYRQFVRTHDPAVKTEWNRLNATVRLLTNRYKEQQWNDACSKLDYRQGRRFWDKLKTLTGLKRHNPSHLCHNNTVTNEPATKANIFADTLKSILTPHEEPLTPGYVAFHYHVQQHVTAALSNPVHLEHPTTTETTPDDIHRIVTSLKNNAPGEDRINNIIIKNLPHLAFEHLAHIFNSCIALAHFPDRWKRASVVMIPKPQKDPTNPLNYRPISLLNNLGKTFERLLALRIRNFCEENSIIPNSQAGFRHHRSTMDPLLQLKTEALAHMNAGHCTVAVCLDIERAFDKVWHEGLLYKLLQIQLPAQLVKLISSYLSNRLSRVRVYDSLSRPFTPTAGVPQGSVLAPFLYLIFCRDIPQPIHPSVSIAQFADDTAYWVSARRSATCNNRMQQQLNRLENWLLEWKLRANPHKTQAICFRHPRMTRSHKLSPRDLGLTLHNTPINFSRRIQYLGIVFTDNLHDGPDLQTTLNKVRQRANLLSALRGSIKGCHPSTLQHTYKTFIRPLIEYRSVLLSTAPSRLLHKCTTAERRILRKIHSLHYLHPSLTIYEDTHMTPITQRLTTLQNKFVKRTITSANPISTSTLTTPIRPSRIPKTKKPYPPPLLLQQFPYQLPDNMTDYLDNIPLKLRTTP